MYVSILYQCFHECLVIGCSKTVFIRSRTVYILNLLLYTPIIAKLTHLDDVRIGGPTYVAVAGEQPSLCNNWLFFLLIKTLVFVKGWDLGSQ